PDLTALVDRVDWYAPEHPVSACPRACGVWTRRGSVRAHRPGPTDHRKGLATGAGIPRATRVCGPRRIPWMGGTAGRLGGPVRCQPVGTRPVLRGAHPSVTVVVGCQSTETHTKIRFGPCRGFHRRDSRSPA